MSTDSAQLRAALDLGSNSFHLLLVKPAAGGFVVIERLKEKVQLLAGFQDGAIQPQAVERGVACLARFAQRLRAVPLEHVQVIGTCALREAENRLAFTERARAILGVPVRVVSGAEEARLVYLGVANHIPPAGERLVVDIGGGSTEFALGAGVTPGVQASVNVGCVALTDEHLADGVAQASGYRAARKAAVDRLADELDAVLGASVARELDVYGTSGTIESVAMVLAANGWGAESITAEGLRELEEAIVTDRWLINAGLPGLAPDRVDIFPAGVAVLSACFEVLGLARMRFVDVSLMQGAICEALQTDVGVDRRAASVQSLAARFAVDAAQARRVAATAARLHRATSAWWDGDEEYGRLLQWAAELHEIGARIDARHYHRHSAYIIKHTSLLGFSQLQQSALALLVRGHRRSLPGLAFQTFEGALGRKLQRLVALLRIAVILERSHNDADSPQFTAAVDADGLTLTLQPGWLDDHPLSARELAVEAEQLAGAGLTLSVA